MTEKCALTTKKTRAPKRRKVGVLVTRDDLHDRGITLSKVYLRKLIRDGLFPKPIRITPRLLAWEEEDIEDYLSLRARGETYSASGK
jgi:predicted DNA-binding transcriptional regulator AlpA